MPKTKFATQIVSETKKQTLSLIVLAFGFAAALLWRDAIMAWLSDIGAISSENPGTTALVTSAIVVTIIAVIIVVILSEILGEKTK